jgi:hypothetical protein
LPAALFLKKPRGAILKSSPVPAFQKNKKSPPEGQLIFFACGAIFKKPRGAILKSSPVPAFQKKKKHPRRDTSFRKLSRQRPFEHMLINKPARLREVMISLPTLNPMPLIRIQHQFKMLPTIL